VGARKGRGLELLEQRGLASADIALDCKDCHFSGSENEKLDAQAFVDIIVVGCLYRILEII